MRAPENNTKIFYNTIVNLCFDVTGNKYTHPGGKDKFSPYIEEQAISLAKLLASRLKQCKTATLELERDGTKVISRFKMTLEFLTEAEPGCDKAELTSQLSKWLPELVKTSLGEVNPQPLLPYMCAKIHHFIEDQGVSLPKIMVNANIEFKRDFWGNLDKMLLQYVIAQEQVAASAGILAKNSLVIAKSQAQKGEGDTPLVNVSSQQAPN